MRLHHFLRDWAGPEYFNGQNFIFLEGLEVKQESEEKTEEKCEVESETRERGSNEVVCLRKLDAMNPRRMSGDRLWVMNLEYNSPKMVAILLCPQNYSLHGLESDL